MRLIIRESPTDVGQYIADYIAKRYAVYSLSDCGRSVLMLFSLKASTISSRRLKSHLFLVFRYALYTPQLDIPLSIIVDWLQSHPDIQALDRACQSRNTQVMRKLPAFSAFAGNQLLSTFLASEMW
jgi:hypothetical protein